ncbi:MAG: S8 family peptidase [Flavobacteriales bacterium]|nr:S8 family peptidase [Flavobacteriales bacterium]
MNKLLFFLLIPVSLWSQADLSPSVRNILYGRQRSNVEVEVWVQFSNQLDYEALAAEFDKKGFTNHERRNYVWRVLHQNNEAAEQWMTNFLEVYEPHKKIAHSYWLNNSFVVSMSVATLKALASQTQISWIELSDERHAIAAEFRKCDEGNATLKTESINGREPGLDAIHAPEMWARGYTGAGRLALILDTGVWPQHSALGKRWRGYRAPLKESWFGYDSKYPQDKPGTHGTHVAGTILGLHKANNDTIGVAFNAQFIADDHVVSNHDEIKSLHTITPAFEWALDPDGDTSTYHDVPDVINNSWGHEFDTAEYICINPIGDAIAACQLGGTAVVWSAGNNGPGGKTIGNPATITRNPYLVFTVGAISPHNSNYPLASFSSRGPSHCVDTGSLSIKPEVVAPGVNIRSSVDTNGYANYQGTSMAGPHVAGAVLLLKEAFPTLPGEKLLEALYMTAQDLGVAGEDNDYGNGIIHVDSAFLWLAKQYTPKPATNYSEDVALEFIGFKKTGITCAENNIAQLMVVNMGARKVNATDLNIKIDPQNGATQSLGLSADLNPGDTAFFNPSITYNPNGNSGFTASLVFKASFNDDPWNNQIVADWNNLRTATLPFAEEFESGLSSWTVENPDIDYTWRVKMMGDSGMEKGSAQLPFHGMTSRKSQRDLMYSPVFNASGLENLQLVYDYAYTTKNVQVLSDTFNIYVASGCNLSSRTRVFHASGDALLTKPVQGPYFWPSAPDWKNNIIDLSQFDGSTGLVIIFEGVNANGNNLYLDNIAIQQDATGREELFSSNNVKVYPNPAHDELVIEGLNQDFISYRIYSNLGVQFAQGPLRQTNYHKVDVTELPQGFYVLELIGKSKLYQSFIKK